MPSLFFVDADQQKSPTPVAAKDEDPWAKFDAEKGI